jgi:putative NADH-flavin reductase
MPVIVVGADTEVGEAILDGLHDPPREVRAFVSDESVARRLKDRGFKVALGDVSDDSHVEAAATRCFSAVLIADATTDQRERAFASTPDDVKLGWANAVARSKVHRVIWVSDEPPPHTNVSEVTTVSPDDPGLVQLVVDLDSAASI